MGEAVAESVKCANVRIEEDMILFDCPHCGLDAEVDESTLAGLWAQSPKGTFECPESEKCGKEFILPTLDEIAQEIITAPPPMGEYHPDPELVNTPPKPKKIEEKPPGSSVEEVPVVEDKPTDDLAKKKTEEISVAQDQPEEKADEETPIILSGASPKKAKPAVSPPKPMTTNGQEIQMAIKTFRHSDWQGGGEDNFDEEVSRFLVGVGTGNVVSVTPISYTDGDAKLDDYGVMVVYKREPEEGREL